MLCICVCVHARELSHVQLCDLLDYNPLGSSVHGIFQATKLEWVAISFSKGIPDPGIEPKSLASSASADSTTSATLGSASRFLDHYIHLQTHI